MIRPKQFERSWVRVNDSPFGAAEENGVAQGFKDSAVSFLALPQGFLRPFAIRDVGENAVGLFEIVMDVVGDLAAKGDENVGAILFPHLELGAKDFADRLEARKHLLEMIDHVRWQKVAKASADHLAPGVTQGVQDCPADSLMFRSFFAVQMVRRIRFHRSIRRHLKRFMQISRDSKVVMPSTAADAKGLLKSSIRDNNPVMFLEQERMYGMKSEVPEDDDFTIPLGVADVKREGSDCTIVARSMTVPLAIQAAEIIQKEFGCFGRSCRSAND